MGLLLFVYRAFPYNVKSVATTEEDGPTKYFEVTLVTDARLIVPPS